METALPLPPPKRARKESVDLADAASAQRFAEVIESSRQLYPVVMTLLAEFDGELAPAMRADGGLRDAVARSSSRMHSLTAVI